MLTTMASGLDLQMQYQNLKQLILQIQQHLLQHQQQHPQHQQQHQQQKQLQQLVIEENAPMDGYMQMENAISFTLQV